MTVRYRLTYERPAGDVCSEIFGTEEDMKQFVKLRHVRPWYYEIEETHRIDWDKRDEPRWYSYFISYLGMKDRCGVSGSTRIYHRSPRLSEADIAKVMVDLREERGLDNLPTITTIYKLRGDTDDTE